MATTVVAEIGINHGGSLERALELVDAAAGCGCDAVKVQAIYAGDFLREDDPLFEVTERCELYFDEHRRVADFAHKRGLKFGFTPSREEVIQELAPYADFVKCSSDYLLRLDMIRAMAACGLPTVISTGMGSRQEIWEAISAFGSPGRLTLLVCTSAYPCPDDEVHLRRLRSAFLDGRRVSLGIDIGFSDHTLGTTAALGAVALGATMIEKHFTFDKAAEGPDHAISADPAEMASLVREVRRLEKMLGSPALAPTRSEVPVRDLWRVREGQLRA